jgi:hypothetical protein
MKVHTTTIRTMNDSEKFAQNFKDVTFVFLTLPASLVNYELPLAQTDKLTTGWTNQGQFTNDCLLKWILSVRSCFDIKTPGYITNFSIIGSSEAAHCYCIYRQATAKQKTDGKMTIKIPVTRESEESVVSIQQR